MEVALFGFGVGIFLAAVALGIVDPTIVAGLGLVAVVALVTGKI